MTYVRTVDMYQGDFFNKLIRLEASYDTNSRNNVHIPSANRQLYTATENPIASAVDTVCAQFSITEVRARVMTDDADWDQQRTAKRLEYYGNSLAKRYDVPEKCRKAFKGSTVKGTACIKVSINGYKQIKVDNVMVDDIVVDEAECRNGADPYAAAPRLEAS